jgi:hypothetical protein
MNRGRGTLRLPLCRIDQRYKRASAYGCDHTGVFRKLAYLGKSKQLRADFTGIVSGRAQCVEVRANVLATPCHASYV